MCDSHDENDKKRPIKLFKVFNFELITPFLLREVDKGDLPLPFTKKLMTVGERDHKGE